MNPITLLFCFLELAAFPASKPLNTLGLVSPCLFKSGRQQFGWVVASSMTWLTWTPGLNSISPEGGP